MARASDSKASFKADSFIEPAFSSTAESAVSDMVRGFVSTVRVLKRMWSDRTDFDVHGGNKARAPESSRNAGQQLPQAVLLDRGFHKQCDFFGRHADVGDVGKVQAEPHFGGFACHGAGGFAGLVGAGRTETMRAVFGADKLDSGEIYVKGEKVHIRTPKDAIKRKIAFLTEDRKGQGLVLNLDVRTNLVLANMKGFSNGPFLDKDRIEQAGNDNVSALKIKTPSLNEVVGQLSGGNQQKVVIGKWVNTDADIFIFDEPTRGIDVGAKIEVYRVMNDLVKAGKCVIMVSSELPEILAMSDHVVVMRGGRVMADIDRDTPHFNSEDIMKAAWGGELD